MKLTKNTLYNISKHTNKTIKIADYLSKANEPILFNAMAMVNSESDDIAFIEAFNKDLAETTKKIEDMHQLLSTVDEKGNVIHLKGEQSLSVIFGDAYDNEDQSILLPFGKIHLKKDLFRDSVKKQVVENNLGITIAEYEVLFKARNKIFKHKATELYSDEDKIEFLSTVTEREKYDNSLNLIKAMSERYTTFRKQLSLEDKSLIDDKITFQRSMVDSVTKGSTYITKIEGVVQLASGHKKDESLDVLIATLKRSPHIDAIELDADTDLKAFINLIEQSEKMKFNLLEAVTLKSRKLGNYNANGLFFSASNIIALDVKSPSAAVHEFVHAVDLRNENIRFNPKREKFASKMRGHLDLSGMTNAKRSYYNSTAEIIARAGEISFLLEEYKYDDTKETIREFAERVSVIQDKGNPYDLNLVGNVNKYIDGKNIYFNLESMPKDDLNLMRDFYKSYFRISGDLKIEDMKNVIVPNHIEHKVIGERIRYVPTSVGLINKDNVAGILDYNEKHRVIDMEVLIHEIMSNPLKLNRTAKTISNFDVSEKKHILAEVCKWALERDNLYVISRIAESRVKSDPNIKAMPYFLSERLLNNPVDKVDDIRNYVDVYIEKAAEFGEIEKTIDYNNYDKRKEVAEAYKSMVNETIGKPGQDVEKYLSGSPRFKELNDTKIQSIAFEDGKGTRLNGNGANQFYKCVDYMLQEAYVKHGDKIFNYFGKDDLFPILTLAQSNPDLKVKVLQVNFETFKALKKTPDIIPYHASSALIGLLDKHEQLKPLLESVDKYSICDMPSLVQKARRGSFNASSINADKSVGYSSQLSTMINYNAYNSIFKNASKVSIEDLTYGGMLSIVDKTSLVEYETTQKSILDYKNYFIGSDIEDAIIELKVEGSKIESNKETIKISDKVIVSDTPIDPNNIKPKRKSKISENQMPLF